MAGSSSLPSSLGDASSGFSADSIRATAKRWTSYVLDAPKATKVLAIVMVAIYVVTHIVTSLGDRPYPLGDILGLIPA